ncbi:hypothetical protein NLG97_g9135 [Lecanicillium saksenae]|uniref:Uncharacterized protein n=1 Tax=Lecanicillium saksenae TaxID=468837 RepID=A0ACC1QJW0_9HYPO|nr:hypothetical protein NLG97_g9135 [Lecanicillium saksenae]
MPSIEKKRARDRRSQQGLRDRKQQRIAELEELVARCKETHQTPPAHDAYEREISALRHTNHSLLQRQELLKSLVLSWDQPDPEMALYHRGTAAAETSHGDSGRMCTPVYPGDRAMGDDKYEKQAEPVLDATPPAWSRIPPHDDDFSSPDTFTGFPWFKYPELIKDCPDVPHSPLDILYGSKLNPLADMIYNRSNRRPFREPERLATGWISYLYTRWMCNPTPQTYARMPSFLRPVKGQLDIAHPMVLDLMPWPQVRVALIRAWPQYQDIHQDLFGLLACSLRIRWPWGENVLERAADNTLVIRDDFFKAIMSESGWTVVKDFVDQYPALFVGVNVESILYKFI